MSHKTLVSRCGSYWRSSSICLTSVCGRIVSAQQKEVFAQENPRKTEKIKTLKIIKKVGYQIHAVPDTEETEESSMQRAEKMGEGRRRYLRIVR